MSLIVRLLFALAFVSAASLAQAQNKVPPERPLEALVKASLLSFNDANVTGNYTVFRAKASKPFREQFPPERLEETFAEFREKNIDFDIVAALKPVFSPEPQVDSEGKLVLKGYFPSEPTRVNFELDFIPSDGEWKLIRINLNLRPASP